MALDSTNYQESEIINDQEVGISESVFYLEPTQIDDYDPEFVAELLAEVPSTDTLSPIVNAEQHMDDHVNELNASSIVSSDTIITFIDEHDELLTCQYPKVIEDSQILITTKFMNIPSPVQEFLTCLYRNYTEKSVYDMILLYENSFHRLSEKYYSKDNWPCSDIVSELFHNDPLFIALYKELYYRHIHVRLSPTIEQKSESFRQYSILFQLLLDAPNDFILPNQWIWDIFDEYLYQFQTYQSIICKNTKSISDILDQSDTLMIWNHQSVLNVLSRFVDKSNIHHYLGESDQYESPTFTRNMGYFALISMLRLYVLTGKFQDALTLIHGLDLGKRDIIPRVISCQLATFHYSGVAYLMSGRYLDSIKSFTSVLAFIRPKQFQSSSKTRFYDCMMKKADQMYALLAICTFIFPFKLEDNIQATLKEKFGDEMTRLHNGDMQKILEDLFCFGAPKFVSPSNPMEFHFNNFYEAAKMQLRICNLRGYLVLYKSISLDKLSKFVHQPLEDVKKLLVLFKRQILSTFNIDAIEYSQIDEDLLLSQKYSHYINVGFDFYMKDMIIYIVENRAPKRYHDYFTRHVQKLNALLHEERISNHDVFGTS